MTVQDDLIRLLTDFEAARTRTIADTLLVALVRAHKPVATAEMSDEEILTAHPPIQSRIEALVVLVDDAMQAIDLAHRTIPPYHPLKVETLEAWKALSTLRSRTLRANDTYKEQL